MPPITPPGVPPGGGAPIANGFPPIALKSPGLNETGGSDPPINEPKFDPAETKPVKPERSPGGAVGVPVGAPVGGGLLAALNWLAINEATLVKALPEPLGAPTPGPPAGWFAERACERAFN